MVGGVVLRSVITLVENTIGNCLEGGVTMGVADSEMEEMDCEERWGDDGEVSMDFDLSEVQQEQMIAEISHTRDTLLPVDSLVSFDLLSGSEANYQVQA